MIVKIQCSLFPPNAATMLIYNKSRSIIMQEPLSSEVKTLLGDNPKGYFHASLCANGQLKIGKRAPAQSW